MPGVVPGTLEDAARLIGRGRVASVVGRLRPEVVGVDVDAAGEPARLAIAAITDWCRQRRLWHLVRPSGGGPDRAHVLVVSGAHRAQLEAWVDAVRAELRLKPRELDVRTQLRPLSAPHRRGSTTGPVGDLPSLLEELRAALEPLPASVLRRRRATSDQQVPERRSPVALVPAPRGAGGPEPLTPMARPRRELPAAWAAYVRDGRSAAAEVDRDPGQRSQIELEATWHLVLAGHDEPSAWQVISSAHPTAFVKARSRGRRWWHWQWNRCVADADRWLAGRRASRPRPVVDVAEADAREAIAAAWARLEGPGGWRSWPAKTRHTDREVMGVVLDRLARIGATAAPIPQRDLVLDCAVTSRTTIRQALARLQLVGHLMVHATYVPGTTDTAHTLALPPPPEQGGSGVTRSDPSRCQPPQPPPLPLPLRRLLGPTRALLAASLTATPAAVPFVAAAAGLCAEGRSPSPRQIRATRAHLAALAQLGLASVDESGRWTANERLSIHVPHAVEAEARRLDDDVRRRVADERQEFRTALDPEQRRHRWAASRTAALARAAKAARARQKAWWGCLSPAERDSRAVSAARDFHALPPQEQAARKHALALTRDTLGEPERARYSTWWDGLSPTELATRTDERARVFHARPAHEQRTLVAAWAEHRARWDLPRHRRPRLALRPSPGHPDRTAFAEQSLLVRPSPTVDELVLFEEEGLVEVSSVAG